MVALVLADFATYSSLRSNLYNQADQTLSQNPLRVGRFVDNPGTCPGPNQFFGGSGGANGGDGGGAPPGGSPGGTTNIGSSYFEVLTSDGKRGQRRAMPGLCGDEGLQPATAQSPLPQPSGSSPTFFTAGAIQATVRPSGWRSTRPR